MIGNIQLEMERWFELGVGVRESSARIARSRTGGRLRSRTDSTESAKRRTCHGGDPRTVPGQCPGRSSLRSWRASRSHPVARPDRGVRVAAGSGAWRRQAVCRVLGRRLRLAVGGGRPQPVVPLHGSGAGPSNPLRPRTLAPRRRNPDPHSAWVAGLVLRVPQDRRDADPPGAPWRRARRRVPRRRPLASRLRVLGGAARAGDAPGSDRRAHARSHARCPRLPAVCRAGRRLGRAGRFGHCAWLSGVGRRPAPQHAGIPGEDGGRRPPPRRRGEGLARQGAGGVRGRHGVLRHPGNPPDLARVRPHRLPGGPPRMVSGEVHRLDRLRRGTRERGLPRRVPDEPDALLGDGQHRLRRARLLRAPPHRYKGDARGRRPDRSADRDGRLPPGDPRRAAAVGGTGVQRRALDGNAPRRTLRGPRAARAARGRHPRLLPGCSA